MKYSFFPENETSKILIDLFIDKLHNSYMDLAKELKCTPLGISISKVTESYNKRPDPRLYNGFYCFAYNAIIDFLEKNDYANANHLIKNISSGECYSNKYVEGGGFSDMIMKLITSQSEISEGNVILQKTSNENSSILIDKLKYAELLLSKSDTGILNEIHTLIKSILFFDQAANADYIINSFTGDIMPTLIFINGDTKNNFIYLIDKVIHECAHTYLFLINLHEELVLNSREKIYNSPLRTDRRDMLGIYHSTFVIQRLIYSLGKILLKSKSLTKDNADELHGALVGYYQKLDLGYKIILNHANLSPLAWNLIEEGQREVMGVKTLLI